MDAPQLDYSDMVMAQMAQRLEALEAERDELLAAIGKIECGSFIQSMEPSEVINRMREIARSALAKVGADKGEQHDRQRTS